MSHFTIVPRARGYWIVRTERDGSRTFMEQFHTEDAAVKRLRHLQRQESADERPSITHAQPKAHT